MFLFTTCLLLSAVSWGMTSPPFAVGYRRSWLYSGRANVGSWRGTANDWLGTYKVTLVLTLIKLLYHSAVVFEEFPLTAHITDLTRPTVSLLRKFCVKVLKKNLEHTRTPTCSSVGCSVLALRCSSWWNVAHWCLFQVLVNRVWAHWKQQLISDVIFNCSGNHHIQTSTEKFKIAK